MSTNSQYHGGENFDLRTILVQGRNLRLHERVDLFKSFLEDLTLNKENLCLRQIASAADREVIVNDPSTGQIRMLMFGSNNYLGLANHPYVKEKAKRAIGEFGAGVGGPPLLNGYTVLHRELEQRLAEFKRAEDALIFPTGFGANVGLVSGLINQGDHVYYDAYSHASFCDGIKLSDSRAVRFPHNDIGRLRVMLESDRQSSDVFVGVEGVYSMDGDLAPLDLLVPLCKSHNAYLILDDAHGTGVLGKSGRGTAELFGVEGKIDLTMGTFSKTFSVTGGFVAGPKPIIDYLRYFARSYMFSASLPPATIATVLAGLEVIEHEPELLTALHDNVQYATAALRNVGFDVQPRAAIIPLRVPAGMNIRSAAYRFHQLGIFVNSVEYPAVPVSQQRFRISLMATHTRADIDLLIEAVESVWRESGHQPGDQITAPEYEIAGWEKNASSFRNGEGT